MQSYPAIRKWLSAALSIAVFAVIVGVVAVGQPDRPQGAIAGGVKNRESWPMYGGSLARNLVNPTTKGLPEEWIVAAGEEENVKWSADLGSKAYGGPIVAGGKVFVGTNNQKPRNPKDVGPDGPIDKGVLMCFDEATGKFLWQKTFPKLAAGQVNDWPREGICSTPVVEGNRIYYVSNRCEIVCTDANDGSDVWKLDMIKELGVFPHNIAAGCPLVVGDKLYVVTANGVNEDHISVPAPKAPSFLCVSKSDGKIVWQNNDPTKYLLQEGDKGEEQEEFFKSLVNRAKLLQHGQWSNPAYAEVEGQPQVVFPGGDGWLYSFEPDSGKLLWKFDCNPKDAKYALGGRGQRNDFIATPVIYKSRVYIGVGQDPEHDTGVGHLWCIAMTKRGDVSPELAVTETFPPQTKKNPNSALVWHYGGPGDPKKLRRNYVFGRTMSTCAIKDDLLYVAELAGILHCLDANTGAPHWTHDTFSATWSSPYLVDNKVFLGTDAKTVFVFAHDKKKRVLAENEMDARVRATPVAANGTLYVVTENKLYAIASKE